MVTFSPKKGGSQLGLYILLFDDLFFSILTSLSTLCDKSVLLMFLTRL